MTDRDEIEALIRGVYEAFDRGDTAAIDRAMHDAATVWDVFTPDLVCGRAEREAFHTADQAQKAVRGPLTWSLGRALIDVWGDVAIARYVLDFSYEPPNATSGRVRVTDVVRRIDGHWLVVHHHEGLVPLGAPIDHGQA